MDAEEYVRHHVVQIQADRLLEIIVGLFPVSQFVRQDEIGTPFCITIDFDSLEDKKVTVRHRDSMAQERIAVDNLISYIDDQMKK